MQRICSLFVDSAYEKLPLKALWKNNSSLRETSVKVRWCKQALKNSTVWERRAAVCEFRIFSLFVSPNPKFSVGALFLVLLLGKQKKYNIVYSPIVGIQAKHHQQPKICVPLLLSTAVVVRLPKQQSRLAGKPGGWQSNHTSPILSGAEGHHSTKNLRSHFEGGWGDDNGAKRNLATKTQRH